MHQKLCSSIKSGCAVCNCLLEMFGLNRFRTTLRKNFPWMGDFLAAQNGIEKQEHM